MIYSRKIPFVLFVLLFVNSCSLFSGLMVPKEYVPDDKVVFLKQKIEFEPIRYQPVMAEPYVWNVDTSKDYRPVNFRSVSSFDFYLKPDYRADAFLLREVPEHFDSVLKSPQYTEMKNLLQNAKREPQKPYPSTTGEKTKDYSNAVEYSYPPEKDARITVFSNGEFKILFSDNSKFYWFANGNYRKEDANGKTIFQYQKSNNVYVYAENGYTYQFERDYSSVKGSYGEFVIHTGELPQINYTVGSDAYILFTNDAGGIYEFAVTTKSGIRYDWYPDKKEVLVVYGSQSVMIDSKNRKLHGNFDSRARLASGMKSIFYPEGIRLANLDGTGLSFSDILPAWPENYIAKQIGPFSVLYTAQDESAVNRLNPGRLAEVDSFCRKATGLSVARARTIIIPPNLDGYRRIYADQSRVMINWYPSGFETKDMIVMWPVSVPRYNNPAGQDYFFATEFYEILAHEYTHLMVGEATGIISPVPVWLNEGLAVYVESGFSADSRKYWDVTYAVSKRKNRLLDWDSVTIHSTGDFPIDQARIHYAQSYAMVRYLVSKYGLAKLTSYLRSFRQNPEKLGDMRIEQNYRALFARSFGQKWEDNVAAFMSENTTL